MPLRQVLWGQKGTCLKMSRPRGEPPQSPRSSLWSEWAKGLPALGKAQAKLVTVTAFALAPLLRVLGPRPLAGPSLLPEHEDSN